MTFAAASNHLQTGHAFRQLCRQGTAELVNRMLEAGFPLDAAQDDGTTGLWLACENGNEDVARLLLQKRANPSAIRNPGNVSCLYVASQNGHALIVEMLLLHGANPNVAKTSGSTPVFIASQQNYPDVVRALLKGGAAPDTMNGTGVSPIAVACFRGNGQVVRHLLAAGADPHQQCQGRTAIEWAAAGGHKQEIQLVIEQHLRQLEAEVQRRRADVSRHLANVVTRQSSGDTPSLTKQMREASDPQPAGSSRGGADRQTGTPADRAAGMATPRSRSSYAYDDDVFSWYTPQFLTQRGPTERFATSRRLSPQRGPVNYNTRSHSEALPAHVGTMGLGGGTSRLAGVTFEVLREEASRARQFRDAVRHTTNVRKTAEPTWETAGGHPTRQQLYATDQQWESHRHRLDALAKLARDKDEVLTDAWMYSAAVNSTYTSKMLQVRMMMDDADRTNREQASQNAKRAETEQFELPRTDVAKLHKLVEFVSKGTGARGPPPPLPPEVDEPKADAMGGSDRVVSAAGGSSVGQRPTNDGVSSAAAAAPVDISKLSVKERIRLKQQAGRSA